MDDGSFRIVLPQQVPRHLRLYLRIDIAIERGNAFRVERDILLDNRGYLNLRNRGGCSYVLLFAAIGKQRDRNDGDGKRTQAGPKPSGGPLKPSSLESVGVILVAMHGQEMQSSI